MCLLRITLTFPDLCWVLSRRWDYCLCLPCQSYSWIFHQSLWDCQEWDLLVSECFATFWTFPEFILFNLLWLWSLRMWRNEARWILCSNFLLGLRKVQVLLKEFFLQTSRWCPQNLKEHLFCILSVFYVFKVTISCSHEQAHWGSYSSMINFLNILALF